MSEKKRKYVICLRADDAGDLEPRKLYEVLPDEVAAEHGYLRVIDESGEDYLYPADYFDRTMNAAVGSDRFGDRYLNP